MWYSSDIGPCFVVSDPAGGVFGEVEGGTPTVGTCTLTINRRDYNANGIFCNNYSDKNREMN